MIVVHIATTDSVVFNIAEGVVYMDVEVDIAVATVDCCVGVNHQCIDDTTVRNVIDEVVAVHEGLATTDGDVGVAMEGVVNVDIEVDIAVATIYCSVGVDNQGVGEVGPVRRVVD